MGIKSVLHFIKESLRIELFTIGSTVVHIGNLLVALVIIIGARLLARLSRRAIERFFENKELKSQADSAILQRISEYAIMLAGLVAALQTIGIDLSTLFAAGAIFAVGIGFAMQNIAQNFVSGIILLVERTIKQGDVLKIGDEVVRVEKMGIRATVARTRNEEEIIVPNALLVQDTVKNYTLSDSLFLVSVAVGVSYSADMKRVREVLEETVRAISWRDPDNEPRVIMSEFGDSSVVFKVFVWCDDPWHERRLAGALTEAIWWALKAADIVIAFPQLDVHFDSPVEAS